MSQKSELGYIILVLDWDGQKVVPLEEVRRLLAVNDQALAELRAELAAAVESAKSREFGWLDKLQSILTSL